MIFVWESCESEDPLLSYKASDIFDPSPNSQWGEIRESSKQALARLELLAAIEDI